MSEKPLDLLLGLDAFIAITFGLLSGLWPVDVFGTIVQLQPTGQHTATIAALTTVSLLTLLIGLVCLATLALPNQQRRWLVLVFCVRHLSFGLKDLAEAGADWQVGSPVPDLVIHSFFALAYAFFVVVLMRAHRRAAVQAHPR